MNIERIVDFSTKITESVMKLLAYDEKGNVEIDIKTSPEDLDDFFAALALSCTTIHNKILDVQKNNLEVNHLLNSEVMKFAIQLELENK